MAVWADVARHLDRRLDVAAPVEPGDQGLRDVIDDPRSAGGAERHAQPAAALEHHRWRHAAAGPLARLYLVRRTGNEIEVGELVVEQEAAHHDAAAERVLDGAAHGDDIALRVDDREVAGALRLRIARRCLAHGSPLRPARSSDDGLSIQKLSN